jgi:alpha-methylacyl-CoA racemase
MDKMGLWLIELDMTLIM